MYHLNLQNKSNSIPKQYLFDRNDLHRLMLPLLIEQFLSIFVGLADSIMVSSVGETAVSAVSLVDTVLILLINLFAAVATGGAIVAGQAFGSNRKKDGCETTEQTLLFSVVLSFLIMFLMYLGKTILFRYIFGQIEPEVATYCNTYLSIVSASIPFLALYSVGAATFRAMGDAKTPMMTSLSMNAINIIGNSILLYGLGMGIEGAAFPTLISRIFAGLWMLFLLLRPKYPLHIRTLLLVPRFFVLKRILYLALPYSFENSMFQLGKILVLSLVAEFGTASITANAVANCITCFAVLGGQAVSYAISSISARCVGYGDYEQVRFYTRKLLKFSYASILLLNLLMYLSMPLIIQIYNLSSETAHLTNTIIIYYAILSAVFWAPAFNLPNALRASNDVGYCMCVSAFSMWIFRIGFSFLLAKSIGLGVFGVWIAMSIDWIIRTIFFTLRYRGKKWQKFRL